jgi:Cytochrome bd terminal oxidase subunit I
MANLSLHTGACGKFGEKILMESALLVHRLHFAFTVTYHYLFPQLTVGLAPLIVVLKTLALWKKDERYNNAARFFAGQNSTALHFQTDSLP